MAFFFFFFCFLLLLVSGTTISTLCRLAWFSFITASDCRCIEGKQRLWVDVDFWSESATASHARSSVTIDASHARWLYAILLLLKPNHISSVPKSEIPMDKIRRLFVVTFSFSCSLLTLFVVVKLKREVRGRKSRRCLCWEEEETGTWQRHCQKYVAFVFYVSSVDFLFFLHVAAT